MRILFIANTFPPGYTGGAEVANYHTCRGMISRGMDCSILVINNRVPQPANEWYELGGIPVHRVGFRTKVRRHLTDVFDQRVYRLVRAELHHLKPDIVHINNVSGSTLAPYVACRMMNVPVVNTLHDLWLLCPNNMLYRRDGAFCDPAQNRRDCRDCYRRYDFWGNVPYRRTVFAILTSNVKTFISPSQAVIDRHVEAGFAAHRFRRIRLGFDGRMSKEPRHSDLRAAIGVAHRHRTIVFVGGGIQTKGALVLLQAIPMMLRHIERLSIIVAGGGEPRYLAQFRRYEPVVRLLGWIPFDEIDGLFGAADLTIIPSVCHENSPVTIYSSLRAGTPVVGSAFGGIPELISPGRTGYLFPVGNGAALAEEIILHFARSSHDRRRMRQHCVEYARTNLTLEKHVEGVLQVYQDVLLGG
jgi:glycosyltransferase involved in cell wall biosynthesis